MQTLSRRSFLAASAAVAAVEAKQLKVFGAQLYSLRSIINEKPLEVLQGLETIVKSDNINASPMIVPVAKKKRRFTSLLQSLCSGPFHKCQTVIIV